MKNDSVSQCKFSSDLVKGADFSVNGTGFSMNGTGSSMKGTGSSVKGTGFSPYMKHSPSSPALAAEGMRSQPAIAHQCSPRNNEGQSLRTHRANHPSGATAQTIASGQTYGLKPVPFKLQLVPPCNGSSPAKTIGIFNSLVSFAIVAALLTPAFLTAQQAKPWEQIPVPKLHDFKPQEPKRIELKNGIVIFLQEDHELPFISGSVLIPGGSRDEPAAKAGLVGIYGQAWRTSGTAKIDGDAMDDLLEAKAAHIETGGDDDSTALSWDSLKGDADQVFALALDLLLHPKFSPEKLELAQQQAATGIVRRNDDESGIAERESARLVYGANSPYTRQPELATIGAVTVGDLKAWHDKTIGNKLIVGISGDFDPVAMEAKLRAAFEGLPPAKPLPPRHDTFPGPTPGVYFINKEDVNQSNVQIIGMGIDRHNPDVPAVAVMNEIFGGGFASRLFQKVRTQLGLAYEVGGGLSFAYDHPGPFTTVALPRSDKTVDATNAMLEEIHNLNTTPFTQVELDRAKDNILSSFLFRYDTKDKVLAERERLEFYGYPADYLETYQAALKNVTVADVAAVAKKYVHPDKLAILVVGNGPEIKPGLDELHMGPVHPIDIAIPQPGPQTGAQPGKPSTAETNQ